MRCESTRLATGMRISPSPPSPAEEEAAGWFTKIKAGSATSDELLQFYAWRKHPENAAAYRIVERFWFASAGLAKDADIANLLQEARTQELDQLRSPALTSSPVVVGALAAAGLVVIAFLIIRPELGGVIYQTGVGEQRTITLSDGTQVRLDTDSRIQVRFTAGERSIDLRKGQAFFDVAHSTARPLTVRAGQTLLRDLGTRFDVRREAQTVQITLVEGSIQVADPSLRAKSWILGVGEQMTTGPKLAPPHRVDASAATRWITGMLVFNRTPLPDAIRELNRYTLHKLKIDISVLGDYPVSGPFDPRNTSGFVSAITRIYPLQADLQENGDVVLRSVALNTAPSEKSSGS